ncbi:MAG: ABC transporter ATP-binding protein [Candidatus Symbiopectobacterium sp. Dall1.0]|nr:ABC transporter ATP-binding protein [Candidatus Symbiopectobacterium sp. Dall1.0]
MNSPNPFPLSGRALTLQYDRQVIIEHLDLQVPAGCITVFVGSNGCGKSTLLKAFARLLSPTSGCVMLNGADIHHQSTHAIARELSILPQTPSAPEDITVRQLVAMGRYPHQSWLRQWSMQDEEKVQQALNSTGLTALGERVVDTLSGIAMTLAQDTDILLLDEPTTYLDLAHQIEVLDLLHDLNEQHSKTIVMVLHYVNLACRYAHHMVAVHQRGVVAQGAPQAILTETLIKTVFDLDSRIIADPVFGTPLCIPLGRYAPKQQSVCDA